MKPVRHLLRVVLFFLASLNPVHEFQHPDWRVGYYLYPPRVGLFDLTVAKWVVFLCRAR